MATVRRLNSIRQALTSIEQPLQAMGAHLQSENGDIILSITHAANENNGAVRVVLVSYGEPIPILIPDESMNLDLVCQSIVAEAQIAHDRHNTRPLPFITQFTQVLEQLRTTHFQQLGLNLIEVFGHTVASRYAPDGGLATSCMCAVSLIEDPSVIREITIARNLSILEATRLVITEAQNFRNSRPPTFASSDTLRQFREFFDSTYRQAFVHYGFTVETALHSPNIIQFHFSNGAYNNSHQVILTDRLVDVERGLFDKLREMLNQLISLSGFPSETFSGTLFGELRILHEPTDLREIIARHSMTNPDVDSRLQDLPVFTRGYTPITPSIFGAARPAGRTAAGFQQAIRDGLNQVSSRITRIPTTRTRQSEGEGSAVAPPGQIFEIARNASERIDALVLENWAVDRGFGGIEMHTLSVDEMAEINRGIERENLPPRRIRKNDSE